MTRSIYPITVAALVSFFCGTALAFEWEPGQFPEGDQGYTLEFRTVDGDQVQTAVYEIDIVSGAEGYDVTTTVTSSHTVTGELSLEELGAGSFGLGSFGPLLIFGPTFMMLPYLLETDIEVRDSPVEILGLGRLHMDRTEEFAGHECVMLRLEMAENEGQTIEFGLAEGLPFPCYSRYGEEEQYTEFRLLEAD